MALLTSRDAAVIAVMAAATAATTMLIVVPFAPTRGFFNVGDALVMFSGLVFGARIGFLAGGIGSALADILLGFGFFAPFTLFIKGMEGYVTGLIGRGRGPGYKLAGVVCGAAVMLAGYFAVEWAVIGFEVALAELVAVNSLQVTFGGIISLALAGILRKTYPALESYRYSTAGRRETLAVAILSIAVLAVVSLIYSVFGLMG
ncbi:MAG: ECF transporter S component [Nitrososphaerota archaeon]